MTGQDILQETVADLVNRKIEGTYWDFKCRHHHNNGDLVHDVLCLANAKHHGNRYLIFGVDDKDFSLHSISEKTGRKTQAEIAGLFRDNSRKFFQSRFPEFYLSEVKINDALLDVLVVEDTPHKPYYLIERYEKICAHHIYTRVCDTNTPVNDAAQPHEIERMWRERFGLDMPLHDRAKIYLNDHHAWISSNRGNESICMYYRTFPEFTLRVSEAEEYMVRHEEWTRGEIRIDNTNAWYYDIYYHQTRMARVRGVSFDDGKKSMIAPTWRPLGAGRFYFYQADSIEYAVHKFHSEFSKKDDSLTLRIRDRGGKAKAEEAEARSLWGHHMRIPVLRVGELDALFGSNGSCESVEPSTDEAEQYRIFLRNQIDFEKWRDELGKS